ncbi:MAG TPA: SipW-dependent-type signal peptide-containing protein [Candidatus Lachnoclostridium pullistercoris]|uniref:SipW-dependent-type signal peptide-containing protein n=1 Tax=Candidatus Lachnoclostridium pullistercoris TaxID=2838632 RepID=A0A9D2PCZ7_9FIRM|nr:SipW-dependent-type signal peptide-containing protein [Candidatus Lachnoclostridium pullistercoris]
MKKSKKWLKSPIHIMVPLVAAAVLVMGTVAYFTDVEAVVNTIRFGEISIETNETVKDLTKSDIGVTANGTSDCYVRIRVDVPTVSYTYTDGTGESQTAQAMITLPDGNDPSEITTGEWAGYKEGDSIISDGKTWIKGDDGFWYLNQVLHTGDTALFIKEITYKGLYRDDGSGNKTLPGNITEDMLTIPITSEAVQADNILTDEEKSDIAIDHPTDSIAYYAMAAFDKIKDSESE